MILKIIDFLLLCILINCHLSSKDLSQSNIEQSINQISQSANRLNQSSSTENLIDFSNMYQNNGHLLNSNNLRNHLQKKSKYASLFQIISSLLLINEKDKAQEILNLLKSHRFKIFYKNQILWAEMEILKPKHLTNPKYKKNLQKILQNHNLQNNKKLDIKKIKKAKEELLKIYINEADKKEIINFAKQYWEPQERDYFCANALLLAYENQWVPKNQDLIISSYEFLNTFLKSSHPKFTIEAKWDIALILSYLQDYPRSLKLANTLIHSQGLQSISNTKLLALIKNFSGNLNENESVHFFLQLWALKSQEKNSVVQEEIKYYLEKKAKINLDILFQTLSPNKIETLTKQKDSKEKLNSWEKPWRLFHSQIPQNSMYQFDSNVQKEILKIKNTIQNNSRIELKLNPTENYDFCFLKLRICQNGSPLNVRFEIIGENSKEVYNKQITKTQKWILLQISIKNKSHDNKTISINFSDQGLAPYDTFEIQEPILFKIQQYTFKDLKIKKD